MQIDPPEISVKTLEAVNPGIGGASEQQGPGALHTSISGLKAPAFLEWPMRDEFGEEETVSTKYRVSMFLRAIYLGLPVPNDMKRKERPRYPQGFSERRAQAKQPFVIQPTTFAYLQKHIGRFKLGPLGQDLLSRAQELMHLFIPFLDGVDIDSHATSILWGAVSEILRVLVST